MMKVRMFPRSHSLVVLGFWEAESCWKTYSWSVKRVVFRGCTTPCSMSSRCTRAPVFTSFSQTFRGVTPWWDTPHQTMIQEGWWPLCTLGTFTFASWDISALTLVILAAVLLLDGEDFLVREGNVFVPVLAVPLEKPLCSCLSDLLQNRSKKVSLQLPVSSQLSGHDLLFLEWISANLLPHYFDSSFSPHTSWVSWPNPVFNFPEFLILFN
jgi:hypothetical protein